jgi:release factor glutamine methyltransferase
MTIARALGRGEELFRAAGCDTPRLDALVLLAADIKKDKVFLYSHGEKELTPEQEAAYEKMLALRAEGLPVSYILKTKEFYGLSFYVDERVLVPRPDTETLVDTAREILRREPWIAAVHDACTGTGCVPIAIAAGALAAEAPRVEISASDVSPGALAVFRLNCRNILKKDLPHWQADLLPRAALGRFDMITANPPYLTEEAWRRMRASGWPEPELALNGGKDGLQLIRGLIARAPEFLRENGWLLMEASPEQADTIQEALRGRRWRDTRIVRDLAGRPRVIAGRRP